MSPGSLSGYTFYRVRPESADTIGKDVTIPPPPPQSYKLMKSMLMSGYTFYRVRPESADTIGEFW